MQNQTKPTQEPVIGNIISDIQDKLHLAEFVLSDISTREKDEYRRRTLYSLDTLVREIKQAFEFVAERSVETHNHLYFLLNICDSPEKEVA